MFSPLRFPLFLPYTFTMTNNLKEYRLKANLRQTDVARILGTDCADRISRWEQGKAFPSVINLFKLAVIYGASPQELYAKAFEALKAEKIPPFSPEA